LKKIWKKYKGWAISIVMLIGIVSVIWFFNKNYITQEEFFNNAVSNSYIESYSGVVVDKYYEKNGGRDRIVVENNGVKRIFDFVYETGELHDFVQINDTLIKIKNTNQILIKRNNFDTLFPLKFENLKGSDIYSKGNELIGR
jgi:hypothetical protein